MLNSNDQCSNSNFQPKIKQVQSQLNSMGCFRARESRRSWQNDPAFPIIEDFTASKVPRLFLSHEQLFYWQQLASKIEIFLVGLPIFKEKPRLLLFFVGTESIIDQ